MKSASALAQPGRTEIAARAVLPTADASPAAGTATIVISASVMLVMGLWGLNRHAMWRDEVATYAAVHRTVPQIWAMVHNVDAVHALYYLGMHVWMKVANDEVWMRIPSVLASAVSAGLVAALGTRLSGVRVGLTAGLMFTAIPFVSFYAQEARSFALVSAWVLTATYCLVRAVDRGRGWWAGYAAAVTVASLTNEFAVLALAAHALTLLISRAAWSTWWRWALCVAFCGLVITPLVVVSSAQSDQVNWLLTPDWSTVVTVGQLFLGPHRVLMVVMGVLVVAGIVVGPRRGGLGLVALAAPLAIMPPLLLIVASFIHPLFYPRYVLFAVAGVPLLAGLGLVRITSWLRRNRTRWLADTVVGLVLVTVVVLDLPQLCFVRTPASRVDNLAAAAAVIQQDARPGDPVIFMPGIYRLTALGYPQAFAGLRDLAYLVGPAEAGTLAGHDLDIPETDQAMLAADHIWVIGRPDLAVRPDEPKTLAKQAVLVAHFKRVRLIHAPGVDVALYRRISR